MSVRPDTVAAAIRSVPRAGASGPRATPRSPAFTSSPKTIRVPTTAFARDSGTGPSKATRASNGPAAQAAIGFGPGSAPRAIAAEQQEDATHPLMTASNSSDQWSSLQRRPTINAAFGFFSRANRDVSSKPVAHDRRVNGRPSVGAGTRVMVPGPSRATEIAARNMADFTPA